MSAQALSDRCTALGHPIDRSVIAKLEKGLRQTISVADLLVLAKALGIPPINLVFPIGRDPEFEVLPGRPLDAWQAAQWFSGERLLLDSDTDDAEQRGAEQVALFREHDQHVDEWRTATKQAGGRRSVLEGNQQAGWPTHDLRTDARFVLANQLASGHERALKAVRRRIRQLDLAPPALPAELAYIDEQEGGTDG